MKKKFDNSKLWFTKDHTGKMLGFWSISTNCDVNPICKKRANDPDSICSKCYAMRMESQYKGLNEHTTNNYKLLTERVYSLDEIESMVLDLDKMPKFFRIESFGDLANYIQAANYLTLCELIAIKRPDVKIGWWTKNPNYIKVAMTKCNKTIPDNVNIIGSSCHLNDPDDKLFKKFDFIGNIFTVYESKYAIDNQVEITCGSRDCMNCNKCYSKTHKQYEINEMLKSEQSKYYKELAKMGY